MKKIIYVAMAVLSFGAFAADWTYDPSAGTISDGDWTFAATVNGTDLTVGKWSVTPSVVTPLDFTKPVSDGVNTYTIKVLNTQFGHKKDNWGNSYSAEADPCCGYVGELSIPDTGLVQIGECAFINCTNATGTITLSPSLTTIGAWAFFQCGKLSGISPVVPDSVTSLGMWSFYGVKVPDDIRLVNVDTVSNGTFMNSSIKSVYFGSGFKRVSSSGWDRGPFRNCANLTNLTFSSEITNGVITGTHNFHECPNICNDIDLTGFKTLESTYGAFNSGSKIKKLIIGPIITKIDSNFFSGLSGLESITFKGKPPSTFGTPIYAGFGSTQAVTTFVPSAYSNEWSVFAADGVINAYDSTFSETYFSSSVMPFRLLVFSDAGGGGGGELGDGVFDNGVLTMPDGWQFEATLLGANLTVGSCIAAPDTVSPLDFSVRITDATGRELRVMVIDTKFAEITCTYNNNVPIMSYVPALGADKVGSLTLPAEHLSSIGDYAFADCVNLAGPLTLPDGLLSIGKGAFANCTSLVEIVNYVPDTVTSVKDWAFIGVPAGGQLRLASVSAPGALSFWKSGIESVYFGSAFVGFKTGNWNVGAFREALSITNLVFDPGIQNAEWTCQHVFMNCQNIEGVLDLSGFKTLTPDWGAIAGGGKITEVIFGEGLTSLHGSAFQGMSGLTNVIFRGIPPKTFNGTYLNGLSGTKKITTTVSWAKCKEPNASGLCWLDYAENGRINAKDSTWISSKVAGGINLSYRPLIAPDASASGFVIIIK